MSTIMTTNTTDKRNTANSCSRFVVFDGVRCVRVRWVAVNPRLVGSGKVLAHHVCVSV